MSRFSSTLLVAVVLTALSCGSESKKSLGETCEQSSDCETELCAQITPYTKGKQCTQVCNGSATSDECALDFGAISYCVGTNLCARACAKDSDCPSMTSCYGNMACIR
jgi:hypothetical protein